MQKITRWILGAAAAGCALPAHAVVQWSRQYNVACTACHTAFPRLNEAGVAFRRNGYRFTFGAKTATRAADLIGPTWGPSMTVGSGGGVTDSLKGVKIHLGGALTENTAFLIQPTPGEKAKFNMLQGMVVAGSERDAFRLTGGRLYAWGNGGGVGAADRFPTATAPRMLANLNGVSVGGLGQGFRLDYTRAVDTTVSVFSTDLSATTVAAKTMGASVTRRWDPRHAGYVELFAAHSAIPVAGHAEVRASRFGAFVSRGAGAWSVMGGALYGAQERPVSAGAGKQLGAGFAETDWQPSSRFTALMRADWERGVAAGKTRTGLTLGATTQLSPNHRLDIDASVRRLSPTTPSLIARLRIVY